jgi:DNA repair protein RecO (recombination protein O)
MLQKTKGIILRSIKYGESSLVSTIFTEMYGVQVYMVQGVRSSRQSQNRAGMFQPGMQLDMVVYQQPQKNMQRIKEFHPAYIYNTVQEDVIKNSIVLFSAELLLRLLPEQAPLPELFSFVEGYLTALDKSGRHEVANFPLYFIIQCSRELGYDLKGTYSGQTPYLDLQEGGFTENAPVAASATSNEEALALSRILMAEGYEGLASVEMNATMRQNLIDWYITFLQQHTEHMGNIRSLQVLHAILH